MIGTSLASGMYDGLTDEFSVVHDTWVELDPAGLRVAGPPTAHIPIVGLVHLPSTDESNARFEDTFILFDRIVFKEDMFCSPETSVGEDSHFRGCACETARLETITVDLECVRLTGVRHWFDTGVVKSYFRRRAERCEREEGVTEAS